MLYCIHSSPHPAHMRRYKHAHMHYTHADTQRGTQGALGLGTGTKNAARPVALPSSGDVKGVLNVGAAMGPGAHLLLVAAGGANSALLR